MSDDLKYNRDLPYADESVAKDPNFGLEGIDEIEFEEQDITDVALDSKWEKITHKIKQTWNGNNKAGKYLGLGLSIGETFLPKWVSRIRDIIQNKTQSKTSTDMSYPKEKLFDKIKRFIKQKSTQTAIVSLLAIVGLVFGIDVDPQVFTETVLGIVTGASAIVASVYNIYQMFQDEDKATKA